MLSIDASVIVIFVIIWVLVYVLSKKFFNPVRSVMAEREAKIQKNRESCEKVLKDYEQSINEIEENLRTAKATSDATREKFEEEAFLEKTRFLEEINSECRSQVKRARERLKKQIKSLEKELESEAKILAERIEQKLLH